MDTKGSQGTEFHVHPLNFPELFENGSKRSAGKMISWQMITSSGIVLNLGCGDFKMPKLRGRYFDLQKPDWVAPLLDRFNDKTVKVIHAYHFLEHLTSDEIKTMMSECSRVMMDGATMNICVPYARADIAFQDTDHKTFFTEESWDTLLDNAYYDTGVSELKLEKTFNIIAGVVGRNLCIYTQLQKVA